MAPGSELIFLIVSFSLEVLRSVGDDSGDGWMATQCCSDASGDGLIATGSELIF